MALGTVAAAKGLAVTGIPLLAGGANALLKAGSLTRAAGMVLCPILYLKHQTDITH